MPSKTHNAFQIIPNFLPYFSAIAPKLAPMSIATIAVLAHGWFKYIPVKPKTHAITTKAQIGQIEFLIIVIKL